MAIFLFEFLIPIPYWLLMQQPNRLFRKCEASKSADRRFLDVFY